MSENYPKLLKDMNLQIQKETTDNVQKKKERKIDTLPVKKRDITFKGANTILEDDLSN